MAGTPNQCQLRELVAAARDEPTEITLDVAQRPEAVVLHLEDPVRMIAPRGDVPSPSGHRDDGTLYGEAIESLALWMQAHHLGAPRLVLRGRRHPDVFPHANDVLNVASRRYAGDYLESSQEQALYLLRRQRSFVDRDFVDVALEIAPVIGVVSSPTVFGADGQKSAFRHR